MIFIYDNKDKVLFINVPKTASESIENALSNHFKINKSIPWHPTYRELLDKRLLFPTYVKETYTFAVMREPLERQLSLYLYRTRQGVYSGTVEDFRSRIKEGRGLLLDRNTWQNRLQVEFLEDHSLFWDYECVNERFEERFNIKLPHINANGRDTKALMSSFYDSATLELASKALEPDILAYEKVKHDNKTRLAS